MTALHLAAGQGYAKIINEIITQCPDCCEIVNNQGWNVLHFAMTQLNISDLKSLLETLSLKKIRRNLVIGKDAKGNIPLHVLAACRPLLFSTIMKKMKDNGFINDQNETVKDVKRYGSPSRRYLKPNHTLHSHDKF